MSSLAEVVFRALKKAQHERYENAGEMHAHLKVIDCMLLEHFSAWS